MSPIRVLLLALSLFVAVGCQTRVVEEARDAGGGDASEMSAAEPVPCGDKTCSPDEYCHVGGGCGVDPAAVPDADCSGYEECIDVPDGCDPKDHTTCQSVPGDCQSDGNDRKITCWAV